MRFGWIGLVGILLAIPGFLSAADRDAYRSTIKPLLRERCFACHGVLKQEGALRLDSGSLLRQGGTSGRIVEPGKPEESPLIARVSDPDPAQRMPPEGPPLTPEQINLLKDWIRSGAEFPADDQPDRDPRDHWSFRIPVRSTPPKVENPEWVRNPIDQWIAAEHDRLGLIPRADARPEQWLRRVYLDLVGYPPTRDDLHEFLENLSPDSYDRVVDRLLDSPQYGERWARHWMDVWRYSDWYGRRMVPDVWNSAPQIWRWRDWIVQSLNEDQGYDQMVREMLAADEVAPEDYRASVATGYLVRNWYALNPNAWMRDNVEHTGKAFLALTFNCAHCHDHKYDPITQEDYFRLRAFFETIGIRQDREPGEADPGPFQEYEYSVLRKIQRLGQVHIFDKRPDAQTWFYEGGDERNRRTDKGPMQPAIPALFRADQAEIRAFELPPRARYPGLRPAIQETERAARRAALQAAEAELSGLREENSAAIAELQQKLTKAEVDLAAATDTAASSGRAGALTGRQSLVLDATTGRRVLQNGLPGLTSLKDRSAFQFQLQILRDSHINFQLAKDVVKGLTAAYIGFVQGKIVSYQPGTFTEFEAGKYDVSAGQNRFDVELILETKADRGLLNVRDSRSRSQLVEQCPVAIHGWNPVGDATKAFSFDVRSGSVAVLDDVALVAPATVAGLANQPPAKVVFFDFEAPKYQDGQDISGIDGWIASSFGEAPATSFVSTTALAVDLDPLRQQVQSARRALDDATLPRRVAEARVAAAQADLSNLEAVIAADRAKYGETSGANVEELSRLAAQSERLAAIAKATANVLAQQRAVAVATAKPESDMNRAKELDAASKQLVAAQTAWNQLRDASRKPADLTSYASLGPVFPALSTGRRRALADWIAGPKNPLTARVAINHIWLRHFHSPLVATVYDFGRNGASPTHPALLDWLALELQDSGWSMKHVHRLIVTSATYRQSSSLLDERSWIPGKSSKMEKLERIDSANRYLWHMPTGRMESEVVRDSLLACAEELDLRQGGQELENGEAFTTRRRSLYYSCHPELDGRSQFGALFDAPDATECYRRSRSIIPQQALALTNSQLVQEVSGPLAKRLWESLSPEQRSQPPAFVQAAFEQVLCRSASQAEVQLCLEFLERQTADLRAANATEPTGRARESLVRTLFNHHEFVTIR